MFTYLKILVALIAAKSLPVGSNFTIFSNRNPRIADTTGSKEHKNNNHEGVMMEKGNVIPMRGVEPRPPRTNYESEKS